MTFTVSTEIMLLVGGYVGGRVVEALVKFLLHLDRETRGPFPKKGQHNG